MDKLKRFIDCYIDTETCNLKCHYCYIALTNKFNNKIVKFNHSPEVIAKALSKERLGGCCLLNFCAGGETLLSDDVIPVIKALLEEGHYVMVVTNGTLSKRFDEIAELPQELLKRLMFKFSFHYLELKRLNWFDRYFDNINKMKKCGCSFTVEITPNDELIQYIDEIKQMCMERLGALCHITIARDDRTNGIEVLSDLDWEQYKSTWKTFDSELFDFKTSIFYKKRREFCYAGDWSVYVNLTSGSMRQCYCGQEIDNIYRDIDKGLNFRAIGNNCGIAHCYNGHAFLTLGVIPELETVSYADVRNRVSADGEEWLNPEFKAFASQKLKDMNEEYSDNKKRMVNKEFKRNQMLSISQKVKQKIKRIYLQKQKQKKK